MHLVRVIRMCSNWLFFLSRNPDWEFCRAEQGWVDFLDLYFMGMDLRIFRMRQILICGANIHTGNLSVYNVLFF